MEHSFGNWVRRRRKSLDLTQQELAIKVGGSNSPIFKIESDERRPSRQVAELLARHLEIPATEYDLFLKMARQEQGVDHLDAVPHPTTPQPWDPAVLAQDKPALIKYNVPFDESESTESLRDKLAVF